MADKIITPEFRSTFVALFRPKASKNEDGTMGPMKYSVRAAFPPSTDLSELRRLATEAATEKWGDKAKKMTIRSPFRLNEELDNPSVGIGDDWVIMTFGSNEEYFNPKTNLVGPKNEQIIDESEIYSGCWFIAQVNARAYETKGNKGVSFYLNNIQKTRNDEPIGGGRTPANKAFEPVGEAAGGAQNAGGLFD